MGTFDRKYEVGKEIAKMKIYQDKKKPWVHVVTRLYKYEKHIFFHFKKVPMNKSTSHFAHINCFFFSYWRDNVHMRFGVGIGKWQYSLNLANMHRRSK